MTITWQYDETLKINNTEVKKYHAQHDRHLICLISGPSIGLNHPDDHWRISFKHPSRTPLSQEIESAIEEFIPSEIQLLSLPGAVTRTDGIEPAIHYAQASPDSQLGEPYFRPHHK